MEVWVPSHLRRDTSTTQVNPGQQRPSLTWAGRAGPGFGGGGWEDPLFLCVSGWFPPPDKQSGGVLRQHKWGRKSHRGRTKLTKINDNNNIILKICSRKISL